MPSPLAAFLTAAIVALAGAGSSLATVAQRGQRDAAKADREADIFLVIARPEASDLYVPSRIRIGADEILRHNPELIRANRDERAYDLRAVARLAWHSVSRDEPPAARAEGPAYLSAVPQSAGAALLSLSCLLVWRGRRRQVFHDHPTVPEAGTRSSPGAHSSPETS